MGYSLYPILCISPRYCTRGDELPVNMHKLLGNSLESIGQFYPRQQLYKAAMPFSKSLFMNILILRDNPILLHTLNPSTLQYIFRTSLLHLNASEMKFLIYTFLLFSLASLGLTKGIRDCPACPGDVPCCRKLLAKRRGHITTVKGLFVRAVPLGPGEMDSEEP